MKKRSRASRWCLWSSKYATYSTVNSWTYSRNIGTESLPLSSSCLTRCFSTCRYERFSHSFLHVRWKCRLTGSITSQSSVVVSAISRCCSAHTQLKSYVIGWNSSRYPSFLTANSCSTCYLRVVYKWTFGLFSVRTAHTDYCCSSGPLLTLLSVSSVFVASSSDYTNGSLRNFTHTASYFSVFSHPTDDDGRDR